MVTLLPIEPRNEQHAMLIIEVFNNLFINGGGQEDGFDGFHPGPGFAPSGGGYGDGVNYGNGGDGFGGSLPEEWLVK